MFVFLLCIFVTLTVYYLILEPHKYWKKKNIPYLKPFPLIGNLLPFFKRQLSIAQLMEQMYNSHPNDRYFGFYLFLTPRLFVKDPELIKKICVKEFDTFSEHSPTVLENADPLLANNIGFMKGGERWHTLRSTLSPAFTSSKLKLMFNLMEDCSNQFVNYFEEQNQLTTLEVKDAFARYGNDVAARTIFGVACDSLRDKENIFYRASLNATQISLSKVSKIFIQSVSPKLLQILNLQLVPEFPNQFFVDVAKECASLRAKKKIACSDVVNLLMSKQEKLKQAAHEIQTEKTLSITDIEIAAQLFVFHLTIFETTSNVMSFAAYELAVNGAIQNKLQNEVDEVLNSNSSKLTYDALSNMKYMHQVVSETLRKWPPLAFTDRNPTKSFTIPPNLPHEKHVKLEENTAVWIPIYPIHRDPKYFPQPDLFNPDRFSKQNIQTIKPYTYFPFGVGPKNCIGSRFALLEIKLILFKVLSKFNIVTVNKTQIPFLQSKTKFFMGSEDGIWLGLQPRNKT